MNRYALVVFSFMAAAVFSACIAQSVCLSDADCSSPEFCDKDSGKCRLECYEAADCSGDNYICRDNVCVLSAATDGDSEASGSETDGETVAPACPDDMVKVEGLFCIDRYEAARADATSDSAGTDNAGTPQSVAGLLPWTGISKPDAQAACLRAGKRLCSPEEWYQACRGPDGQTYCYGRDYEPQSCNGIDAFCAEPQTGCGKKEADSGIRNFKMMPSGSFVECTNEYGVFDINGNVWEWDDSDSGQAHGGAYNCIDSQRLHRCDFVRSDVGTNPTPNIGFRCCKDAE